MGKATDELTDALVSTVIIVFGTPLFIGAFMIWWYYMVSFLYCVGHYFPIWGPA